MNGIPHRTLELIIAIVKLIKNFALFKIALISIQLRKINLVNFTNCYVNGLQIMLIFYF